MKRRLSHGEEATTGSSKPKSENNVFNEEFESKIDPYFTAKTKLKDNWGTRTGPLWNYPR